MGVSGYNVRQSLYALEHWCTQFSPDIVILGYALNDTEGPLWRDNPTGGRPRRDNVRDIQMGAAEALTQLILSGTSRMAAFQGQESNRDVSRNERIRIRRSTR